MSDSMTPLQAAARAAYEANPQIAYFLGGQSEPIAWQDLPDGDKATWIAAVRAAFAAVRVPSEAMLMAAADEWPPPEYLVTVWQLMVDALLSEGE